MKNTSPICNIMEYCKKQPDLNVCMGKLAYDGSCTLCTNFFSKYPNGCGRNSGYSSISLCDIVCDNKKHS